jgi:hypothetical protein
VRTSVADPHADVPARALGAAGHCPGCATPLAGDERFCIACGLRVAPDELRLAALPLLVAPGPALGPPTGPPAFRRPVVRSAATTAVVVLAFGIAVGATIGPAAVGETAAAQRPVVLVAATPVAAPAAETDELPAAADDEAPNEVQSLGDGADASADTAALAATPPAGPPVDDTPSSGDTPADTPPEDEADAPVVPAPSDSQQLAGVVVASAADGEGFVLTVRDGRLLHVHASGCGVALGDDLHLRARPLANAAWSADRVRRVGASDAVRVAGTVVWTDPAAGRYALGARGVTLFVTVPPPAALSPPPAPADGQTLPAAAPPATTPELGARLLVRVALAPSHAQNNQAVTLLEQARHDAPPPADPAAPAPPLELAGTVQSVDAQARTLSLALDPDAQPPLTLSLSVPLQVDLARLLPAQHLAVTATAAPDGVLALSGVSPDGDALAADDATAFQGDQRTSTPPDGDQTTTTVATCTSLRGAARSASGLKNFTTPPPDRNEGPHKRS